MIIDAICNKCKKKIGYASISGDDAKNLKGMDCFASVKYRYLCIELLCDECRVGRIDLAEGDEE